MSRFMPMIFALMMAMFVFPVTAQDYSTDNAPYSSAVVDVGVDTDPAEVVAAVTADHPCMGYRGWVPPGSTDTDAGSLTATAFCVNYRERYWRLLSAEIDAVIDSPYLPYDRWSQAQVAEARAGARAEAGLGLGE